MKALLIVPVVLLTLNAWIVGAEAGRARAADGRRVSCSPGHAGLTAIDAHAQVYKTRQSYGSETTHKRLGSYAVYVGCVFGSRRTVALGPVLGGAQCGSSACQGVAKVTLAGPFVAYEYSEFSGESSSVYKVAVTDLRSGHTRTTPTGSLLHPETGLEGVGPVEAIVCTPGGDAAWIALDSQRSAPGEEVFDVYAFDKNGLELLDSGTGVAKGSLAVAGKTAYWTDAGTARSVTMG